MESLPTVVARRLHTEKITTAECHGSIHPNTDRACRTDSAATSCLADSAPWWDGRFYLSVNPPGASPNDDCTWTGDASAKPLKRCSPREEKRTEVVGAWCEGCCSKALCTAMGCIGGPPPFGIAGCCSNATPSDTDGANASSSNAIATSPYETGFTIDPGTRVARTAGCSNNRTPAQTGTMLDVNRWCDF